VFLFGGGTLALLAFSPIGRALAERIRGRAAAGDDRHAELAEYRDAMAGDLEGLRQQMAELAERVDFAERLLAKQRDAERMAPPSPGGR